MHIEFGAMPGGRMGYWIATVLRDERERAGITIDQLATATGVNWRTIKRLEGTRRVCQGQARRH